MIGPDGARLSVPDGEPCPDHPAETSRLLWIPGVGLYSQCRVCIDEFLVWFGAQRADRGAELASLAQRPRPKFHRDGPRQIGLAL